MIIACDGSDGVGKTTVIDLLRDYYTITKTARSNVPPVYTTRHPGSTPMGAELRRIVKDPQFKPSAIATRLIFAADSRLFEDEYLPKSESGAIVLCDRFSRCTDLVYGTAEGLDLDQIEAVQSASGVRAIADWLFIFQCPFEVSGARKLARAQTEKEKCRIEQRGAEHAKRVSAAYADIKPRALANPSRLQSLLESRAHRIVPINADRTAREILVDILRYLGEA